MIDVQGRMMDAVLDTLPQSVREAFWAMRSQIPEGSYKGAEVSRFTVPLPGVDGLATFQAALACLRYEMEGRPVPPGQYTKLVVDGQLWMSDTPAEMIDHLDVLRAIEALGAERVLLNGLGLGCVLQGALAFPSVTHVDVVERDVRVMALVGKHFQGDKRVLLHTGDAFEIARGWDRGTQWDVAWHDIWPSICPDNLADMRRLHRSYARRVRWQGSWCRRECERARLDDRNAYRQIAAQLGTRQ